MFWTAVVLQNVFVYFLNFLFHVYHVDDERPFDVSIIPNDSSYMLLLKRVQESTFNGGITVHSRNSFSFCILEILIALIFPPGTEVLEKKNKAV